MNDDGETGLYSFRYFKGLGKDQLQVSEPRYPLPLLNHWMMIEVEKGGG